MRQEASGDSVNDKEVSRELGVEVRGPGFTTLEQLILDALPEEWRKKIAYDLHLLQQFNNGNYKAASKAVEKLQKVRADKKAAIEALHTQHAHLIDPFCLKHGDPLVCLACEAERDDVTGGALAKLRKP
jgi:hypothetical protein